MSNLELIRERLGRAFEEPDFFYEIVAEDVMWDLTDTSSPVAGLYRGREAVREMYGQWSSAFSDWGFTLERLVESGDNVVAFVREYGEGRESGVRVEMERANVWTVRDGKIVAFKSFSNRADALEYAGLPS